MSTNNRAGVFSGRRHPTPSTDILQVGFVGGTGGASSLMRELALGYQARGFRTRVLVPAWESTAPYVAGLRERGVDAAATPWLNLEGGRLRSLTQALRAVASFRAPVVHYHLSDNYMAAPFLRAMNLLRPARAFASVHSPYDEPPADDPGVQLWARLAPSHFRLVICVSNDGRERQLRYGLPPSLITIIRNGVDIARFGAGEAAAARAALPSVPAAAPLIICTARLEEQKQPLTSVAAFARVAEEFPQAQLVLVGRGPLEQATRAAAAAAGLSRRVHMVGHQTNIPDWLAAAAVWILPTLTEGFSIGLLEAMAAGCLIVSTWCSGNDEVLVDNVNALAVPVGDVDAIAAALRRSLADASLHDQLPRNARLTAARFSLETTIDEHLACYGLPRRVPTSN